MKRVFLLIFIFITAYASETTNDDNGEALVLLGDRAVVQNLSDRVCYSMSLSVATAPLLLSISLTLFSIVYELYALTFVSAAWTLAALLLTGMLCCNREMREAVRREFSFRQ